MAISFVGSASVAGAGSATVSLDLTTLSGGSNSAPSEGDLVVVAVAIGDADGVDGDLTMSTAGYTEVADLYAGAAATEEANLGVFYKFMGASVDTTAVANNPLGADSGVAAVAMVFRGVKAVADGGPFDVAATTATGTGTGDCNPPSIDISGTGSGIWTVIAGARAHTLNSGAFTNPTGYTTNARGINGNDTTDACVGIGYKTNPSDPEDPGAMVFSGVEAAAQSWCAVTMALAEAAAAATLDQPHFRIRSGDTVGLNTDSGWAANLDTNATIDAETVFRIRFEIATTGNAGAKQYKLQYRRNGGSWTDVVVRAVAESAQTASNQTEIMLSGQYVNDDATTNLLSGSGLTFEAGVGLEDNLTPSITLNNEHTEYEWALRIRTMWHDGTNKGRNADGDTFEYRIVESGGTAFTGTYTIPTVTLNIPDGLIGGTSIETPKRMGPFMDTNGNLYYYMEYSEPNASDEPAIIKSTDGGKQWAIMDQANAPDTADGADDNESIDIQQVGSVLHIAGFHGTNRVRYHTFRMSDNASPDTWGVVSEVVADPSSPSDQDVSIGVRSDGSVICAYQAAGTTIGYKIRSTGGTWGSETNLDTTAATNFSSCIIVVGASDLAYLIYKDHTNDVVYYKTLTSSDTLSGRTAFSTGTVPQIKAVPTAEYFDDAGTEVIVAFYRRTAGTFERRIIGGSLQTERAISDAGIATNQNGSGAPEAVLTVWGDDIHSAWVDGTDTSLVKYDTAQAGGSYGTDVTKYDSAITGLSTQGGKVYRHSGGNGGALVMAVVVDEGDGFTGGNRYVEWTVSETAAAGGPAPLNARKQRRASDLW